MYLNSSILYSRCHIHSLFLLSLHYQIPLCQEEYPLMSPIPFPTPFHCSMTSIYTPQNSPSFKYTPSFLYSGSRWFFLVLITKNIILKNFLDLIFQFYYSQQTLKSAYIINQLSSGYMACKNGNTIIKGIIKRKKQVVHTSILDTTAWLVRGSEVYK